jgi:hypothetical protein
MRPRRQIIIVSDDSHDAEDLSYVLRLRTRVEPFTNPVVYPADPGLIIVLSRYGRAKGRREAAVTVLSLPHVPVLYIAMTPHPGNLYGSLRVTRSLSAPKMIEVCEAVWILVGRKHGPKRVEPADACAEAGLGAQAIESGLS